MPTKKNYFNSYDDMSYINLFMDQYTFCTTFYHANFLQFLCIIIVGWTRWSFGDFLYFFIGCIGLPVFAGFKGVLVIL